MFFNSPEKFHKSKIRQCCVEPTIYPSLVLVQPRKTRPYITERLLMGCKESNQTNKLGSRLPGEPCDLFPLSIIVAWHYDAYFALPGVNTSVFKINRQKAQFIY